MHSQTLTAEESPTNYYFSTRLPTLNSTTVPVVLTMRAKPRPLALEGYNTAKDTETHADRAKTHLLKHASRLRRLVYKTIIRTYGFLHSTVNYGALVSSVSSSPKAENTILFDPVKCLRSGCTPLGSFDLSSPEANENLLWGCQTVCNASASLKLTCGITMMSLCDLDAKR